MQLDNISSHKYTGSWHCVRSLVQSNGIKILYTGHAVNTFREMTFLGTYFYCYEGLRQVLVGILHSTQVAVPVAGRLAGATAWFVSFPLDCVRAGVQGTNLDANNKQASAWDVLNSLVKSKGIRGLYSGVTPSIARAFLVSGSRFSAYEGALWLLRGPQNDE